MVRLDPTPTSASQIAGRLRQYITHRRLKPGDQLPKHEELGRRLKIGPRRLREGLSILKHQGFIETRNKGGTLVHQPSVHLLGEPINWHLEIAGYEMADLVAVRAYLECGAAAEAAQKRTARDLLVILDTLEQLAATVETGEKDVEQDQAFHLAILAATHNPVFVTFGQLVRFQFQFVHEEPYAKTAEVRRAVHQEHRNIYEAIARQDAAAAKELMYTHIMGQLNHHFLAENSK